MPWRDSDPDQPPDWQFAIRRPVPTRRMSWSETSPVRDDDDAQNARVWAESIDDAPQRSINPFDKFTSGQHETRVAHREDV